jgi:hypothetical protein
MMARPVISAHRARRSVARRLLCPAAGEVSIMRHGRVVSLLGLVMLLASSPVHADKVGPAPKRSAIVLKPPAGFRPSESVMMLVGPLAATTKYGAYHPLLSPRYTKDGQEIVFHTALLDSDKPFERAEGERVLTFAKQNGFTLRAEEPAHAEGLRERLRAFGLDHALETPQH